MKRCGKRFGRRSSAVCVRPEGHRGRHSVMMNARELWRCVKAGAA